MYGKRIDGNLTLGEDIADVGGLDISHVAFQRAVQERYSRPPTQLEQQIYFTAAAQNWCLKQKQKEALLDIITEEHAPERVRMTGQCRICLHFRAHLVARLTRSCIPSIGVTCGDVTSGPCLP